MKKSIAVAAALATAGGLTYSAVPSTSSAAQEDSTVHVRHFLLKETGSRQLGPRSFAGTDQIRSRATKKVVGFDTTTGTFDPKTKRVVVWVAIALKGGTMQGRVVSMGGTNEFHGRLLNGTGAYLGVRGTIAAQSLTHHRTAVTLRYTT